MATCPLGQPFAEKCGTFGQDEVEGGTGRAESDFDAKGDRESHPQGARSSLSHAWWMESSGFDTF